MRNDILEKKEKILQWITENQSKSFICKQLKCKPITLEAYLIKFNIEYKGNMGLKGMKIPHNKQEIAYFLKNGTSITSYKLKNKLLKEGVKERFCESCKLENWNNQEIPLELHHKDGDSHNNELSNLELLCPNCHAQTSTYRTKNCK